MLFINILLLIYNYVTNKNFNISIRLLGISIIQTKEEKKMTAEDFRKKSRRAMSNKKTRAVKVGRFYVTSHAQNQMIERDIPKRR